MIRDIAQLSLARRDGVQKAIAAAVDNFASRETKRLHSIILNDQSEARALWEGDAIKWSLRSAEGEVLAEGTWLREAGR